MTLTPAQQAVLKADILADPVLAAKPNNSDGAFDIAKAYNVEAVPAFTVWKTKEVSVTEVGDNIVGSELAGLTSLNVSRLQAIIQLSVDGVNPSLLDRRQFFDDIFSGAGGVGTRAKLLILWKRIATRGERLFATGTGTDVSPGTRTFVGSFSYQDVESSRNS